ncbi:hypothetical protein V8E36_005345 [Tilletia maclaganii]
MDKAPTPGSALPAAAVQHSSASTLGVRASSQATPLKGNTPKRSKDQLVYTLGPRSRLIAPLPQSSAADGSLATHLFGAESSVVVKYSAPHPPGPPPSSAQSTHAPAAPISHPPAPAVNISEEATITQAAAPPPANTPPSVAAGSKANLPPRSPAPAHSSAKRSGQKPPSERLKDYRLLSTPSSRAYDVANRGGVKDRRVFVVLPAEHPTRTLKYWDVRDTVDNILSSNGAKARINSVDPVSSGLVLTPTRTSETREILQHAEAIKTALAATKDAQVGNPRSTESGDELRGAPRHFGCFWSRDQKHP